jgi:lysophospholipase L1-like esterase
MNESRLATPSDRARGTSRVRRGIGAALVGLALGGALPACGAQTFVATQPTVRVEYWQERLAKITSVLADEARLPPVRLLFLGDSITDFWQLGDNPWIPGQVGGRAVWDATFGEDAGANRALNLGISGDRTEHVLYRLVPKQDGGLGELDSSRLEPEFVVLMIGINNTWAAEKPADDSVFAGIRTVIETIHQRKPKAKIIVESLLPTNDEQKNAVTVVPVNRRVQALVATTPMSGYATYLDLYAHFVDGSGRQIGSDFMDGLHPNEAGYRIWRDALLPALDQARRAGRSAP